MMGQYVVPSFSLTLAMNSVRLCSLYHNTSKNKLKGKISSEAGIIVSKVPQPFLSIA